MLIGNYDKCTLKSAQTIWWLKEMLKKMENIINVVKYTIGKHYYIRLKARKNFLRLPLDMLQIILKEKPSMLQSQAVICKWLLSNLDL